MLKNKIIVRKIRNIIILLMVLIVMIGVYKNIGDSRAEKVIEIDAMAFDNYRYSEEEKIKLKATKIDADLYEIILPETVNNKKINRIQNATLRNAEEEVSPTQEITKVEIEGSRIYLTKEQLESKRIDIEFEYDVVLLTREENGTIKKELLVEKTEEDREKIQITEKNEILYGKTLKYEDEERGKKVEVKGYLPKDAELQVEEVSHEKLKEIFGEAKIDVAYDIKIVRHVKKVIYTDEHDLSKGQTEKIEKIEINPEIFGETLEVLITDSNIAKESSVYHVDDNNNIEKVDIKDINDGNVGFEAKSFSVYAIGEEVREPLGGSAVGYDVSVTGNNTTSLNIHFTWEVDAIAQYAWSNSTVEPSSGKINIDHGNNSFSAKQTTPGTWYIHLWNIDGSYIGKEGPYTVICGQPTITVSGYNSNWTNANSVTFNLSGTNYTSFQWRYSGGSWNNVSNNSVTFYDEQNSTVQFKAYCSNCNEEATTSKDVKIDRTKPSSMTYTAKHTSNGDSYTSGQWTNKEVTTKLSAVDALSGISDFQYSKDKNTWTTASLNGGSISSSGTTYTGNEPWVLNDRDDTYYFRAVDKAGNVSQVSSEFNIKYDTIAPVAGTLKMKIGNSSGSDYTDSEWTNQDIYIEKINGSDSNGTHKSGHKSTTYTVKKNGAAYLSNQTQSTTLTETGVYTIIVKTEDNAGNTAESSEYTVKIDKIAPTGNFSVSARYTNQSTVTVTVTGVADTGGSGLKNVRFDGWYGLKDYMSYMSEETFTDTSKNTYIKTFTFNNLPDTETGNVGNGDGAYFFDVNIFDNAGNRYNSDNVEVTYDTTNPGIIIDEDNSRKGNLVRYYDATNNTGSGTHSNSTNVWADLTGTHNGIVNGGTWSEQYISLDGVDDWINLGQVKFNNEITLETTIAVNEIQSGTNKIIIGNLHTGGVTLNLVNGVIRFGVYDVDAKKFILANSGVTANVGEIYHITGTFDGHNVKIYINGELKATEAFTGTYRETLENTVMAIGANPKGTSVENNEFANIKVYSAKIYDNALTQEEIQANINPTHKGNTWKKTHNVTVKLLDALSGLASENGIKYGWSANPVEEPSSYTNATLSYSEGDKSTTFTATGSGFTGKYYLWVKSTTLNDRASNSNTATVISKSPFYFDNTAPLILTTEVEQNGLARSYEAHNNIGNGYDSTSKTWTDLSGNEDGVLVGAVFKDKYLDLDGIDDRVNLGIIDTDGVMTLETTVEFKSLTSGKTSYILSNMHFGGISFYAQGNELRVQVYDAATSTYIKLNSGVYLNIGEKYHLATTLDNSTMKIYVNGELVAEREFNGTYRRPLNNNPMTIGVNPQNTWYANSNEYTDMKVYSARVYTTVLTQEQIQKNINYQEDKKWAKTHRTTVTLVDAHSGLAEGASIQYGWSESETEEPSTYTTINSSDLSYSEKDNKVTFIAEGRGINGKYYLWVKPITLNDVLSNTNTSSTISINRYWFDNEKPRWDAQNININDNKKERGKKM